MSYRTSIYNNNHTQIQKIFSRGGLRDNSVYQGKSEAYFWTFWTPPLDLCMIMIFCQFQCEFNAWHEKKFHILQCMYVYIHITHVQMELDWAPPPKNVFIYIFFQSADIFTYWSTYLVYRSWRSGVQRGDRRPWGCRTPGCLGSWCGSRTPLGGQHTSSNQCPSRSLISDTKYI